MMMSIMKSFILWVSALVLLGGCTIPQYAISEPKVIVLKTPKLKFADTGYIRSTDNAVEVELFSAGQAAGRIEINHLVCVDDEGCLSKSDFNEAYLSQHYPDGIMQHILLGKPIFSGKSLRETDAGFEQVFNDEAVNIIYRVDSRQIYFKDKKNKILIKIKTIPGQ